MTASTPTKDRSSRARGAWRCCLLFAAIGLLGVVGGCANRETAATRAPEIWRAVELGLCEDYPEETRRLDHARADLAVAKASGATVLRVAFGWDAIETRQGTYDWSFWDDFVRMAVDEFHLKLIPYVCYTPRWAASDAGPDHWRSPPRDPRDFARFMAVIVDRYRDAVSSWELWNEPDNPAYWLGTPAQFAELIRAGSEAVRAADSRDTIVLGGIAGEVSFLEQLIEKHRIAPAVDVVNIHSYYETWHPDPIESLPEYVNRVDALMREHGEREPIWMAEVGYSSVGPRHQTSEVYRPQHAGEHTAFAQANALTRTLLLALATEKLSLVAWYRINDLAPTDDVIGDDNNRHLGLRDIHSSPKPALAAFAQLTRLFAQNHRAVSPKIVSQHSAGSPLQVCAFALEDGRTVVAAWLGLPPAAPDVKTRPTEDSRRGSVRVRIPDKIVRSRRFVDAIGHPVPDARQHAARDGLEVTLPLTGSRVVLCFAE